MSKRSERGRGSRLVVLRRSVLATTFAVVVALAAVSSFSDPLNPPEAASTARPMSGALFAPGDVRSVAVIGDSLASSLVPGLVEEAARHDIAVADHAVGGCGVVRGMPADEQLNPIAIAAECDAVLEQVLDNVAASRADAVLWLSSWETANRIVDERELRFGTADGDRRLLALVDETARRVTKDGRHLVILTVPHRTARPGLTGYFAGTAYPVVPETPAEARSVAHLNDLLQRYATSHPALVSTMDLATIVCPNGAPCPFEVDGVALRPDDGRHFAGEGPAWVGRRILDRMLGA